MVKDRKENRLSFRITPETSKQIEKAIENANFLKDRSDFGTRAVNAYLEHLKLENEIKPLILDTILKMSKEVNVDKSKEIDAIKKLLVNYT